MSAWQVHATFIISVASERGARWRAVERTLADLAEAFVTRPTGGEADLAASDAPVDRFAQQADDVRVAHT